MKYLEFDNHKIPLTCITGLSYDRAGNIVQRANRSYRCIGMNPVQVQVQISLSASTCIDGDWLAIARDLVNVKPQRTKTPSFLIVDSNVILPQLYFMLSSVNATYQSDRLGNLVQVDISWTLSGCKVVKDENREPALIFESGVVIPRVTLHCKGQSIECANDINIAGMKLNSLTGKLQLVLSDSSKEVSRAAWQETITNASDCSFDIENYGTFYVLSTTRMDENWLEFDLSKFGKDWRNRKTVTFLDTGKEHNLKEVFPSLNVKSDASFAYYQYSDQPINALNALKESLGFLIGVKGDTITLYDTPDTIAAGAVTYDYPLASDVMTTPVDGVCVSDGVGLYFAGDIIGETISVDSVCRVGTCDVAGRLLKFAKFEQNIIILDIPWDARIQTGSIVSVHVGAGEIKNCICTEYEIDFLSGRMTLELHYIA